jgi:hypothetical protein
MKVGTRVVVYDSRLKDYEGIGRISYIDPNGTNKNSVAVGGPGVVRTDEYRAYNEIIVHKNQCRAIKKK